jgi:hypothetical protein
MAKFVIDLSAVTAAAAADANAMCSFEDMHHGDAGVAHDRAIPNEGGCHQGVEEGLRGETLGLSQTRTHSINMRRGS